MKKITIVLLLLGLTLTSRLFAQNESSSIKWMSITEAEKLSKDHPKKILIDVYTDWCRWCKQLDNTTYRDPAVVKYVNDNFYAVKLNAESKDKITYQGKEYSYDASKRVNDVAINFLGTQAGYPTTTFLDEKLSVLSVVPGYQSTDMMSNILHFFGDNRYLTTDWNTYLASINNPPKQ